MKILYKPDPWVPFESTCKCTTKVALDPPDVIYTPDTRDGDVISWKCPTCKSSVWVAASVVPTAFMRAVRG